MARIIQLDSTFTDGTLPVMKWLASYEAKILALSGLAGWWDASAPAYRTVATGVAQLVDRAGGGRHMVQATTAKQPPASTSVAGVLIPRDALSFDGATDRNLACASFFDGSGTWSFVTYSKIAATGVQCPISPGGAGRAAYYSSPGVTAANNAGSISPTGGILNQQKLLFDIYTATDQYIECGDKTSTITSSLVTAPTNGDTLYLGEFTGSSSYKMNGLLFEAMVFKSDLRTITGALALLREYFAYKYER